jgi:hypothetical protein
MNKDRALFWMNRRIKALEALCEPPDQEVMADARISYAERQVLSAKRDKDAEAHKGELASLREVVAFIQEKA